MALETKLEQRLSQQLVMTPQLRQAIKILQVSRPELEQLVEEELAENPVLEETTGLRDEAEESAPRTEERLETVGGDTDWTVTADQRETTNELEPESGLKTIDWGDYLDNYSNDWHGASATAVDYDDERPSAAETTVTRRQSLSESLLWQLQMNELDPREESVTALLVGNLDKDGYLQVPIEDIAFQTGKDYDVVNRALHRIQALDPPGVGARNLRECLLLQLRAEGQEQSFAITWTFWRESGSIRLPGNWMCESRRWSWRPAPSACSNRNQDGTLVMVMFGTSRPMSLLRRLATNTSLPSTKRGCRDCGSARTIGGSLVEATVATRSGTSRRGCARRRG